MKALIAGAGIAGLAAGIALRRAGLEVNIPLKRSHAVWRFSKAVLEDARSLAARLFNARWWGGV